MSGNTRRSDTIVKEKVYTFISDDDDSEEEDVSSEQSEDKNENDQEENENDNGEYEDDGIADWACTYCLNDDPKAVARCNTCGKWFCNSYYAKGSHIIRHLIFSDHRSITMHQNGLQTGYVDVPIHCFNNPQHNNIFNLGIIQNNQGYFSVICRDNCMDKNRLREIGWDAETWRHLVHERHIVSFMLNDKLADERNVINVSDQDIIDIEKAWKECPQATFASLGESNYEEENALYHVPLVFGTAKQYQSIFEPLINNEEESDRIDNDSKRIEDVSVQWENGLANTKIAIFNHESYERRYQLFVGQEIQLHYPVSLQDSINDIVYNGKVIKMFGSEIHVEISEKNIPIKLTSGFVITFSWNAVTFCRMRRAIEELFRSDSLSEYLYERLMGNKAQSIPFPIVPIKSYSVNKEMELNSSQIRAVEAALKNELTLIQGPPGTGKTLTSSTIVYHLVRNYKQKVLVCAPSNIATDNLTLMIRKMGLNVVRVVARSKEAVSSNVERFCLHSMAAYVGGNGSELHLLHLMLKDKGQLTVRQANRYKELLSIAEHAILQYCDVICCTCTMASDPRLLQFSFPNVLIDEATQAREPECIIPIVNGCKRLVLVGDHQQLGPVILNQKAKRAGFGMSLFERLLSLDVIPYRLNVQYRMHPALSEFPSNVFYNGELQNGVHTAERTRNINFPWPCSDKPMMFWTIMGTEDPGSSGRSLQNRLEAAAVDLIVGRLLQTGITGCRIGVITPYDSQRTLLRQHIQTHGISHLSERKKVEITSVDEFQGREKDYIIFSCVRSNSSGVIGFLTDYRRLNVALTRAKYGLFIVGNPNTLKQDPLWAALLGMFQHHKCMVTGATLDNLSHYVMHIRASTMDDFRIDDFGLAKKRMNFTSRYQGPDAQMFEGISDIPDIPDISDVTDDDGDKTKMRSAEIGLLGETLISTAEFGDTGI